MSLVQEQPGVGPHDQPGFGPRTLDSGVGLHSADPVYQWDLRKAAPVAMQIEHPGCTDGGRRRLGVGGQLLLRTKRGSSVG